MSKQIAQLPVPSFHHWKFNMPGNKVFMPWKPVYHATALNHHAVRQNKLVKKRQVVEAEAAFHAKRDRLLSAGISASSSSSSSSEVVPAVQGLEAFRLALQLNSNCLNNEASQIFESLHSNGSLTSEQYVTFLRSFACEDTKQLLLKTEANYDDALAMKMLGDWSGAERAADAITAFEACGSRFALKAAHYNALMDALLTCGYTNVKKVSNEVYDAMGVAKVSPNAQTYGLVMKSLCLQANTKEARNIMRFLRDQAPADVDVSFYNTILMGHRQEKDYEACSLIWSDLKTHRNPRPNVMSADLYLRSIIDHSYAKVSDAHQQVGPINTVERKRIPIVVTEMEELGIPQYHLTPPVRDEVYEALRTFKIDRRHFYNWGRSTTQFDYMEFRKKSGWLYDIPELNPTVVSGPVFRPMGADAVAPFATTELPGDLALKPEWERAPLSGKMSKSELIEHSDPKGREDRFQFKPTDIHDRSAQWINEVPETRYDKLYGVSNPKIPQMGIRRHLLGDHPSKEDILHRDAVIMRNALSSAKRVRAKAEKLKTHRE